MFRTRSSGLKVFQDVGCSKYETLLQAQCGVLYKKKLLNKGDVAASLPLQKKFKANSF